MERKISRKYLLSHGFKEIDDGQFRKDGMCIDELAYGGYNFNVYIDSKRRVFGKVCPLYTQKQLNNVLKIFVR